MKILLWDPDQDYCERLRPALERAGLTVIALPPGGDPVAVIRREGPFILAAGELDGGDRPPSPLAAMRDAFPELSVVVLTATPSVSGAIAAIRAGVVDYLLKRGLSIDDAAAALIRAVPHRPPAAAAASPGAGSSLICRDPAMARVALFARKAAVSDATVLIQGESGTGKEVLSRFIHHQSRRADKPFVAINCAALPANLLESELFGHEKGAFTGAFARKPGKFELAHGGTLLLDEVSEMDLALQSKLLRVIQEGEVDRVGGREPVPVDVRIIATTNRLIREEVDAGRFRQDLYFRLNVIPLTIPPLRERPGDIDPLLELFIDRYRRRNRKNIGGISPAARRRLHAYDYPGNIRELENIIERAVVFADGTLIEVGDLLMGDGELPDIDLSAIDLSAADADAASGLPAANSAGVGAATEFAAGMPLAEVERRMIFCTLDAVDNNRTRAAEMLGISIRTLRNKLKEYRETCGLTPENRVGTGGGADFPAGG
ncbi:MAG: sigma-54-dependent Fis family transcriptional regulator [Deltaproteobacteria bacterium]|nr:sigma-54-dependent Fis family transcriptional regulator [Candidatus Anaeroferrophillacea bacterium]